MAEQIENQTTSLLDEIQNFIKTNKSILLWGEKVISIKDNKICLKKCSGENREIDEHIFIEFIIE